MLSLPLAIACIVALIHIRATVCGDPLIWAYVEIKGKFDAMRSDCSSPGAFQMRADGSWLPSSELGLSGHFEEDCGIHLYFTIPGDESEVEKKLRSKIEKLERKMKESEEDMKTLESKELELKNEERMHREDMKKLENEKDDLDKKKKELASIRSKLEEEEARRKGLNAKKMKLKRKKKKMGEYADEDFVIRTETSVRNKMSGVEKEIALSQELLRLYTMDECKPISNADYMASKLAFDKKFIWVCEPQYFAGF